MQHLLILTAAMAISVAVIPLMTRIAAPLGLVDVPAERKVHQTVIPRVGGWGIFAGALITTVYWLPFNTFLTAYVIAAVILFFFGVLDDRNEMGHYAKFGAQFTAVLILVFHGGLYISHVPFFEGYDLPPVLGMTLSTIALVGMINAANHSDGLDGLAGGEGLLSLGAMALIAYYSGQEDILVMAVACAGAIMGFLRFNTHPARLFMGDGGSQFLGMTLGVLAILVAEHSSPKISPAAVLLMLGFPIADILVVLGKRVSNGMNWFRATRNHVHHRLLDLGFVHRESVVIIYGIQSVSVMAGYFLRYQSDWVIIAVYLILCAVVFGALGYAERIGWSARDHSGQGSVARTVGYLWHLLLIVLPRKVLLLAVPAYLMAGSVWAREVPPEFGWAALAIAVVAVWDLFLSDAVRHFTTRMVVYSAAALVAYMLSFHSASSRLWNGEIEGSFFLVTALALAFAIRFSPRRRFVEFRPTTLDYLVSLAVLSAIALLASPYTAVSLTGFLVKLIVLFYACEFLIIEGRMRWGVLNISSLVALSIMALRGIA